MEAAKLRAAESAASCHEVSKREKMTLVKFQSWEKQKTLFQEDLAAEKRKLRHLQQKLQQAKDVQYQAEYKDDIEKLEKDISQLRLKTDSSKIAALRRGIDGSYASKVTDSRNTHALNDSAMSYFARAVASTDLKDLTGNGGVKRERECVMCLSEEMSVVFLPCAHQVVCTTCNELHEKQGMKDCPSCRSPIQRRVCVRYHS
ncbi:UNVERIFIED_CONTAM: putative E3 ubiquitin-protein ligase [Sesamum calycinum]|uniref:E3 ubiquitin-protein ligase n=1 Tax=Sesamum calycinum TaxID=2727403 RepID=A0AAW2IWY1_9LAMI